MVTQAKEPSLKVARLLVSATGAVCLMHLLLILLCMYVFFFDLGPVVIVSGYCESHEEICTEEARRALLGFVEGAQNGIKRVARLQCLLQCGTLILLWSLLKSYRVLLRSVSMGSTK